MGAFLNFINLLLMFKTKNDLLGRFVFLVGVGDSLGYSPAGHS